MKAEKIERQFFKVELEIHNQKKYPSVFCTQYRGVIRLFSLN
jgi:hypothetical protein